MDIYYENEGRLIYLQKEDNKLIKKRINSDLPLFLEGIEDLSDKNFLLDEKRFSFYGFDISIEVEEKVTIKYLKELIKDKELHIDVEYGSPGERLFYIVDDVFVNFEKKKYLIGESGKIHFRLNLVYLKSEDVSLFKRVSGGISYNSGSFKIYPQSFFVLDFLKNSLNFVDYNLLYIGKSDAKLLQLEKGFYSDIDYMNLGIDRLKEIFEEDNISRLYFDSFKTDDLNEFSYKLVDKSIKFYSKMLLHRLQSKELKFKNIVLIGDVLGNKFFLETFGKMYSKESSGYVIPFHYSDKLKTFKRKWTYGEVDILTFLNSL